LLSASLHRELAFVSWLNLWLAREAYKFAAGLVYPTMLRYLILSSGFNNAVRYVATLVGASGLFSFFAARPNPEHKWRELTWSDKREWVDTSAFKTAAYSWFVAAISMMFFGFYAVFFNLEEVRIPDQYHGGSHTANEIPSGRSSKVLV
jgi:hypothetical protein